jgi:RNA polymerase sigma-70 factor (ECF subfamily)
MAGEATDAVEAVVRESYGRLLAFLASQTSDIAAAEDALADALEAAVRTWPERGMPARPESWMLTVARRSLIGGGRRRQVADRNQVELALRAAERDEQGPASSVPDKRLELLFACAHPAIDPSLHAPLMLQTVLGLDAARIAAAFLTAPTTLGQQLVRAKRKIKLAGVPFRVPGPQELPERAGSVADAIYAAYGTGWDDPVGDDERKVGLVPEALRLVELLCELLPDDAEAHGLAALLWHTEARRPSRRAPDGSMVPLSEQDPASWSTEAIARADGHLRAAAAQHTPGPWQVQSVIQAVHNRRAATGATDWPMVVTLYGTLLTMRPTVGAQVARAGALLEAEGPDAALAALAEVDPSAAATYQPWWAVRLEALIRAEAPGTQIGEAYGEAVRLSADPAVRAHLARRVGPELAGPADL